MDVKTSSFVRETDADGRTVLKPADLPADHEWMVVAKKPGHATAFFGFQPIPIHEPGFLNGNRDISYGVTDRPVYRPGDRMHSKFFLRNVGYFEPDDAKFAGRVGTFTLLQAARAYFERLDGAARERFRFLHVSTDEVFGSLGAEGRFSETTAYDPHSDR